jgi:hypothetical protein
MKNHKEEKFKRNLKIYENHLFKLKGIKQDQEG